MAEDKRLSMRRLSEFIAIYFFESIREDPKTEKNDYFFTKLIFSYWILQEF